MKPTAALCLVAVHYRTPRTWPLNPGRLDAVGFTRAFGVLGAATGALRGAGDHKRADDGGGKVGLQFGRFGVV
jgi:hypothetical protein